jgi:hypothetical protein
MMKRSFPSLKKEFAMRLLSLRLTCGLTLVGILAWLPPRADAQTEGLQKALEKLNQALQTKQKAIGGIGGSGGIGGLPGLSGMQGLGGRNPVNSGRLGAVLVPVDATIADQLDLSADQGLVVRDVRPASAAEKAGIKAHDILWQFNGQKVPANKIEFVRLMDTVKADEAIDVVVVRKGKQETIKGLKLPAAKAEPAPRRNQPRLNINPAARPDSRFNPPVPAKDGLDIKKDGNGAFVTQYREEKVVYTLTGKILAGKAQIDNIHIRDGNAANNFGTLQQVPEDSRPVVEYLVRLTEKKE